MSLEFRNPTTKELDEQVERSGKAGYCVLAILFIVLLKLYPIWVPLVITAFLCVIIKIISYFCNK